MPSAPPRPTTELGLAIQTKRAAMALSQDDAAAEVGLTGVTFSRLERGKHIPSYDTAVKLSRWLGWTVEEVMAAAGGGPDPGPSPERTAQAAAIGGNAEELLTLFAAMTPAGRTATLRFVRMLPRVSADTVELVLLLMDREQGRRGDPPARMAG
ncbi:MAG TPA: helix-turn-helix transcriptional regulator [Salinarimonas sp.]|nr:helix-turn-helix transcriptional regulator [Salinarimonas sp.]